MTNKVIIVLFYTIIIVTSVFHYSCAPVAPIQSPRIISTLSISSSAIYSSTKYSLYENGINKYSYRPYDMREFGLSFNALPVLHFGIAERVEVSGHFLPLGEYVANYGIRAKLFLFDIGRYRIFRNCATAICGGLNRVNGEWDDILFFQSGLIFGTRMPIKKGEVEFVLIPTYFNHSSETHAGESTGIYLHEIGLDNSIGAIYWPFYKRILQINIGLTIRTAFTRELNSSWGDGDVISHISPFIIQGTVVFNIVRS